MALRPLGRKDSMMSIEIDKDKFRAEIVNFNKSAMKIYKDKYNKNFFFRYEPKYKAKWNEYWCLFKKVK